MKTSTKPRSAVIYSGPSLIDGSPIVVVAIVKSDNRKTGPLIQSHILRADVDPLTASRTGQDFAICGNCTHRGTAHDGTNGKKTANGRTCYVNLGQGPLIVYKGIQRGIYPTATREETRAIGRGRMVRLGTYGDPQAVPATVWDDLLADSLGHTGYTHQHNASPDYRRLMASADTPQQAAGFHAKGIRTFRVIPVKQWEAQGRAAMLKTEALCPASKEAGYRATCDTCRLCSGSSTRARSIAIVAHGTARNGVTG